MIMLQASIAKFTYLFLYLRGICDLFGVSIQLYLFIEMSLSSEQPTCAKFCACQAKPASTQIGVDHTENSVQLTSLCKWV